MNSQNIVLLFCRTLVQDEDQDTVYSALLTKVDVSHGPYGLYNFYQLQVHTDHLLIRALYRVLSCMSSNGNKVIDKFYISYIENWITL